MNDALDTVRYIAQRQGRIESLKDAFKDALIAHEAADPQGVEASLRAIHDAAVDYFSSIEHWVASMSQLPGLTRLALQNLAESCIAALSSYLNYWDYLGREGQRTGLPLQARFGPDAGAELYPQMHIGLVFEFQAERHEVDLLIRNRGISLAIQERQAGIG